MTSRPGRRFWQVLAAVIAFGGTLRFAWLGSQAPSADEANSVWTAFNYVLHGQPYPIEPFHPVLRNVLVFLSVRAMGGTAIGTKAFSLLFGTLLIGAVCLFVRRATGDDRAGLFAAGLVALDVVQIDYSRQSLQEVHAAFFMVLGAWLVVEALRGDVRRWRWLVPLAGVSFGLGVASKYYAIPALLLSLFLLLRAAWERRHADEAVMAGVSMGPLAFLPYLLTYLPWFGRGYDVPEWIRFQLAAVDVMRTHDNPPLGLPPYNRAALWFVRPFYAYSDVAMTQTGLQTTIAVGNPLVWLAVLPAAAYSLLSRDQRRRDAVLLAFFFATYLPLALSTRPIWMLSSVAVFPFAAGVLASVASTLSRRVHAKVSVACAAAVVVTSLLLYPLAIGRALDYPYLKPIVDIVGRDLTMAGGGSPQ